MSAETQAVAAELRRIVAQLEDQVQQLTRDRNELHARAQTAELALVNERQRYAGIDQMLTAMALQALMERRRIV